MPRVDSDCPSYRFCGIRWLNKWSRDLQTEKEAMFGLSLRKPVLKETEWWVQARHTDIPGGVAEVGSLIKCVDQKSKWSWRHAWESQEGEEGPRGSCSGRGWKRRQSQCPIFEGIHNVSYQATVSLCVRFSSPPNFPVTLRIENSVTCICIFKIISFIFVFK